MLRDHIPYCLPILLQIENSHENICIITEVNTFIGYLHKTIYIYFFFHQPSMPTAPLPPPIPERGFWEG